jgi:hypothetical protein
VRERPRGGVIRRILHRGVSVLLLVVLTVLASVGLWVAMPLGWFWVAGRVEAGTGSLGAAVVLALVGVVGTIVVAVPLLGWLNRKRVEHREAVGLPEASGVALEAVLVVSATVAVIAFGVWFFFFAGAQPFPLGQPS